MEGNTSCTPPSKSNKSFEFQFDSLSVKIWGQKAKFPGKFYTSFQYKDSSYLVLTNCKEKEINIFNLSDTSKHYSILLPDSLSIDICDNAFGGFFNTYNSFYLLNSNNGQIWRYNHGMFSKSFELGSLLDSIGLIIDPALNASEFSFIDSQKVILPVFNKMLLDNECLDNKYPISLIVDISSKQFELLGLNYPCSKLNNFCLLDNIYSIPVSSKIVYNFQGIPEINVYDLQKKTFQKYLVRSKYQKSDIKPLSDSLIYNKDRQIEHLTMSGEYSELVYDSFRNFYYLTYTLPRQLKTSDGYYSTVWDARLSLIVLDSNFSVIHEELLPNNCYYNYYISYDSKHLYVNCSMQTNVSVEGINYIKIDLNEK